MEKRESVLHLFDLTNSFFLFMGLSDNFYEVVPRITISMH